MSLTYPQPLTFNAGPSHTGAAANVSAGVYDNTGTLQANVSTGWVELTAGSGVYASWALTARNTSWGAIVPVYRFNNLPTYAVAGDPIPVSAVGAGVLPAVAFNTPGGSAVLNVAGNVGADVRSILGTLLGETVAGYLSAAFRKLFDVSAPTATASTLALLGSQMDLVPAPNTTAIGVIQAGLATAAAQSALSTAVANLNNLSALANLFGPTTLEVPATGSIAYPYTLIVKDAEGHLTDLSAAPTVTAINAAGTSRSANLSAVTHPGTGQYAVTYAVAAGAVQEGVTLTAAGNAASDGTPRVALLGVAIVAVDTGAALTSIQAAQATTNAYLTANVGSNGANLTAVPYTGPLVATIQSGLATAAAVANIPGGVWSYGGSIRSVVATSINSGGITAASFASGVLPANFGSLALTAGQSISSYAGGAADANAGAVTTSLNTINSAVGGIPAQVWGYLTSAATIVGSLGAVLAKVGGWTPLTQATQATPVQAGSVGGLAMALVGPLTEEIQAQGGVVVPKTGSTLIEQTVYTTSPPPQYTPTPNE